MAQGIDRLSKMFTMFSNNIKSKILADFIAKRNAVTLAGILDRSRAPLTLLSLLFL
jgi:hypothetical protein